MGQRAIQHGPSRRELLGSNLQNELEVLRQCIEADLEKHLFAFIDPKKVDVFNHLETTWKKVLEAIPDSQFDIEEALVSYMVELNTATGFHLMRVAEQGLRILAHKMRPKVSLTHKGHIIAIDYADWEKVITAIKNQITTARQAPVGAKRQAQLEKFSDAADHCVFTKDIWRNIVSHARKPYNAAEALAVLERVRDFMLFISKESARTRNKKYEN
ncbi:MAG TPA: hypothetical protein VGD59_05745 [Acidisarcina sp.]